MKSPQKVCLAQLFHPLRKQVLPLPYRTAVLFHRTLGICSFDYPYFLTSSQSGGAGLPARTIAIGQGTKLCC